MTRIITGSEFLKDVATHQMEVILQTDVYRHIRFKKPTGSDMYFDLITWPGTLCYTGDMGTYVFSRLRDMFEFFRTTPEGKAGLHINLGYWAEKLQAVDRNSPPMEFSKDLFNDAVRNYLEGEDVTDSIREAAQEELIDADFDTEHDAYRAAYDFEHDGFTLQDFFDHTLKDYTFRFVWCCYAMAWGIQQYDAAKSPSGRGDG